MKPFITLLAIGLSFGTFAQEFSGKATYETKVILKDLDNQFDDLKKDDTSSLLSDEMLAQIKSQMSSAMEKTYILEFTKNESMYTQEKELTNSTANSIPTVNVSISVSSSTDGKLYKNLQENYSLTESDYLGKTFIIKDSLHHSGWELSTETKQIGNYTAYKATKIEKTKQIDTEENTGSLTIIDTKEPEDMVYTAWYTPEIPIPNGPEKFGGLPGLILELHTNNMVYLCSEIELNPKKTIQIKAPKGKPISQEEYDKKVEKHLKNKNIKNGSSIQFESGVKVI